MASLLHLGNAINITLSTAVYLHFGGCTFLAYFPYFEKKLKRVYEITLLSVCPYIPLPTTFEYLNQSL
jgi:hypothetical protein